MSREEALERAADFLVANSATWASSDVRTIPEDAFLDSDRLVVPYDHADFLDRGRSGMQLAGNLPIAVNLLSGECAFISWEEAERYMDRDLL
jgi:hypothetical protein